MAKRVTFWTPTQGDETEIQRKVGSVTLHDDGTLSAEPKDKPGIQAILKEAVLDPDTDDYLKPETDPARWLTLLVSHYSGSYFWATEPEEVSELGNKEPQNGPRTSPEGV